VQPCRLLDRLAARAVYGPAGAGKTTLALYMLSLRCGSCLYVSTERLDFLRRAEQMGLDLARLKVLEAVDYTDYGSLLTYREMPLLDAVAVDSVNAFTRMGEEAQKYTMLLAAALRYAAEKWGLLVVETAQVHQDPETGRLEPLLWRPLSLWADAVIEAERRPGGERVFRVQLPEGPAATLRARLTGRGIEWLECSHP